MALMAVHNQESFGVGDIVRVYQRIDGERTQAFQGMVISIKGQGSGKSFTVRKISSGVGVERIFPLAAPVVERVEVVQRGLPRRSKLYYLRKKPATAMAKITKRYLKKHVGSKPKVKKRVSPKTKTSKDS